MRRETKRNFAVGGAFLAVLLVLLVWQRFQKTTCNGADHIVLVVVDYTDRIGDDARSALKDRAWRLIEAAPDYSRVILRPILGADGTGNAPTTKAVELCRVARPAISDQLKGAKEIREKWHAFKGEFCGVDNLNTASIDGTNSEPPDLRCGDSRRGESFFEVDRPESQSSPILEQVVDNARKFLPDPADAISWDLVIATDWKQYTAQVNLHTKECVGSAGEMIKKIPLFIGPNVRDKPFRATPAGDAKSRRSSTITSVFVLREGMSDAEADCLEQFAKHFIVTNASSIPPNGFAFDRLPRTAEQ